MTEALPFTYNDRFGEVAIKKGTLTDLSLYFWDVVPECTNMACKADPLCKFDRKGRCTTMVQYLKSTSVMLFKNFGEVLDEPTFYRIGMHLMPMYRLLCRLKIEELGVTTIVTQSDTGRKQANPIYKEIRDTIKLIDSLWNSLGLTDYVAVELPPELPLGDDNPHGVSKMLTKAQEEARKTTHGKVKRKLVKRKR